MLPTLLTIIGTRPEVIKMSPVLRLLRKDRSIKSAVCVTAQQKYLLPQSLSHFRIDADYSLEPMASAESLSGAIAHMVDGLRPVLASCRPDLVLVQGDTTSALAGAMAARFSNIPVVHVEAGLRTGNLFAPFPEEINRQVISRIAQFHFATTSAARDNLLNEGVSDEQIWVTGSTGIDALRHALVTIENQSTENWMESISSELLLRIRDPHRPLILVTGHRRENLGPALTSVCQSIAALSDRHGNWDFVVPLHPNPAASESVSSALDDKPNVFLTPPLNYTEFVFLMSNSTLIVTDSGGIQEEAPSLGIPLLVTRDCTERIEGVNAGVATIVGSHPERLKRSAEEIVRASKSAARGHGVDDLYGDGRASWRIRDALVGQILNDRGRDVAV